MKVCSHCKVEKEETEFNKHAGKPDGLQGFCKPCQREANQKSYRKNPGPAYEGLKRRRDVKREFVWNYLLTHPCVDCTETDPLVLDFDHVGEKRSAVSLLIWTNRSLSYIQEEISRCVVRCANCHRRKTAKQMGWYKWKKTQHKLASPKQSLETS